MLATIILMAAAVGVTAQNFTPTLTFDLVLTDMSPLLQFFDSPPWEVTFSNSTSPAEGDVGLGTSAHVLRTVDGARNEFVWRSIGSGFRVEGSLNTSNPAAIFWSPQPNRTLGAPPGPVLADTVLRPLDFRPHATDMRADTLGGGDTVLTISNITVYTGMQTEATELVNVPTYFVPFVTDNNEQNTYCQYQGTWDVMTTIGPPGKELAHRSLKGIAGSKVLVPVPPHTAFLMVNGTAGPDYDTMFTRLRPPPVYGITSNVRPDIPPCNASRPLIATNQPMYYAILDPGTNYSMIIEAPTSGPKSLGLHSVTFYSAVLDTQGTPFTVKTADEWPGGRPDDVTNPLGGLVLATPSSKPGTGTAATPTSTSTSKSPRSSSTSHAGSKTNAGAIAGGVVGGVAVIGLLLLGLYFLRRKKPKPSAVSETSSFVIDNSGSVTPTVTPFRGDATTDVESPKTEEGTYSYPILTPATPIRQQLPSPKDEQRPVAPVHSTNDPPDLSGLPEEQTDMPPPTRLARTHRMLRAKKSLPVPPTTPVSPTHDTDAGRLLPPMYDPRWGTE